MKLFEWDSDKNKWLKKVRGITFDDVVFYINQGCLLDTIPHPDTERYSHQKMFILNINDYAYLVPFIEKDQVVFLKTIIPSRKATKKYLRS